MDEEDSDVTSTEFQFVRGRSSFDLTHVNRADRESG